VNKRNRTGAFAGLLMAAAFVGACSNAGATTAPATAAAATPAASMAPSMAPSMAAPSASPAMMDGTTFGAACSAVPATGAGSFQGMATAPVATAASNNPVLSTLVTAVTAAKLGDTLNGAKDITVFAPTNDAFAAMDKATLDSAMADPSGLLSKVLTYHVVQGRLTPEMLAGTHKTLNGADLTVEGSGQDFTVNGKAMVVCGNVQTANATVYIIDGVLLPPAS
jgi:uncharacterized surface protein with fasciclin (FAS1) repeats